MRKNKLCLLLGMVLLCLSFPIVSNADESQDHHSEGKVTFFGKYIESDPNDSTDSVGSSESEKNTSQDSSNSKVENNYPLKKIPQTGDTSDWGITMIGFVFTVSALYLVRKYKKVQWSESV
ncbi:LPXTG cell wall anchor domain-containing protein [Bacillus cereus]|uniref:LPXTG-domain-containing protein cell wall anchor domain n=1 Tax=Bacillus cereus MC67 TaxID=1053219 RepID=J8EI07_BACCE|nr:LPXTG cell wall anchor domain-containing protein [Bacillus cereus]EJQ90862.1 LPXTG-domain-containing protein cell wall anchor domain [Bacillus cereus MC67]EOO98685.1 LPXTG-domain-containing protein cell wall anchor domain [Bacillus cereus MC118]